MQRTANLCIICMCVKMHKHLYGFTSLEQRELFQKLIQVSGIGPKGALAILASGKPTHVIQAIEMEDEAFLVSSRASGKKRRAK